jgi:hypothetical protein
MGSGTEHGYPPMIRSKDERLGLRQRQRQEQQQEQQRQQKQNPLIREKATAKTFLPPAPWCRKETVDRAVVVMDGMTIRNLI